MVYVISFNEMNAGVNIGFCSNSKSIIEEKAKELPSLIAFEIETRYFDFDITDADQVYSVNQYQSVPDVFIDIQKYYKTYEEATAEVKYLEKSELGSRYQAQHITVIN